LIAEQLQAARAAHWRQQKNPILTLDDAAHWVEQHPLCLYLPRRAQLPVPAPSFVEAVLGTSAATPGSDAISQAQALLARLIESGTVVALNLFGAVGEQPDFVVARQALPYVLCLRADADWKHAPEKSSGHKVSPLVLELWKALNNKDDKQEDEDGKHGSLTALEARETLGRELTEAAVLRGLSELWQSLRVAPVFQEPGQPARWELLRVRHRDALAKAGATGQVTALSLLVSIYLQSVYAASSEEIEIFLSPLASRSRVREAVRGLSATRQVQSLSMDAQTYYFLEGGLPEFAESAVPSGAATPLPGPAAVNVPAPRRPLPPPVKDQGIRPAAATKGGTREGARPASREWKKPRGPERSTFASPSFPATGSFNPTPGPSAKPNRGPQRNDGAARSGARPGQPPRGRETKPARPEVGREWRKPSRPGKPAAPRPSYPSPRSFPPASAQRTEKTPGGPRGSDAAARGGARPEKRFGARPERPRGERPAPWARSGPKPPFRSAQRPRPNLPTDRPADRPGNSPGERRRPDGPVSGRPAGIAPARGRPSGRPPASFRPKPGGSGPGRSGPGSGPGSRPGTEPRRAGPGFGPKRQDGRSGGQAGASRSSYPSSRPPRPSFPSDSDSERPRSAPSSRPAKPWQRTGSSSARPSGRPGGRPAGKFGGKPGGKPAGKFGGKPGGRSPGDFPPRKPARKKPGA
jgi:23S rRNA pseudouridine2605 synthase